MECFYSYRINGDARGDPGTPGVPPILSQHPEWVIYPPWMQSGVLDFSFSGARAWKLSVLQEAAENYDYDGIELDFARVGLTFPIGRQWEKRAALTEFVRSVRAMTLDIERRRGRPFLLAARIPENIVGCHLDGIDVETWVRERLVDIFALGCRSFDVDVEDFRRITAGANIKLYPGIDEHHTADGYQEPPIEVLRGVYGNWWGQGADGAYTFNWAWAPGQWRSATHLQAYREIGSPDTLRRKNKTFVVGRRGGGHASVIPFPEEWSTPRVIYDNSNMFGELPAELNPVIHERDCRWKWLNGSKPGFGDLENHVDEVDTQLNLRVQDDIAADAAAGLIQDVALYVLLSDPAADGLPESQTIGKTLIKEYHGCFLYNTPPATGVVNQIEMRLNWVQLGPPVVENGWLVYRPDPNLFAVGKNLVGIRDRVRDPQGSQQMTVEKVELRVKYRP
jgi:hypothetical protein